MASYDNPWTFNGIPFESEDIDRFEGFVYLIENTLNGKKYIGRKYFHSIRKTKGKSRRQKSESDWKTYYGSSPSLQADVEELGLQNFKRVIISLHKTRGDCNYEEVRQQFVRNVLENTEYYNENINGKWRRKPDHIVKARRMANDENADGLEDQSAAAETASVDEPTSSKQGVARRRSSTNSVRSKRKSK